MRLFGIGLFPGYAEGSVTLAVELHDAQPERPAVGVGRAAELSERTEGHASAPFLAGFIVPERERDRLRQRIPTVGGLDSEAFRSGDPVRLDGGTGMVELPRVTPVEVVTSFLEDEAERILLFRRSNRVGTFRGQWAGVSGYLESAFPEDQARQEILEETGIGGKDLLLLRSGERVYARSAGRMFVVHPFRFRVRSDIEPALDWENTEFRWVRPADLVSLPTVPRLARAWAAVADTDGAVRKKE